MSAPITLFANGPSPNPYKVAILLEVLEVNYNVAAKDFNDGPNGVMHPDFLKINPNGRFPAIIDHSNNDKNVWESGAILLYLAERFDKTGKYTGNTLEERTEVWQWIMFQVSGLGPIQGNASWFKYFCPVKNLHPIVNKRFFNETKRIYGVLEKHLQKAGDYIAFGRFTLADMIFYPWVNTVLLVNIDLEEFPNIQAWYKRIKAFPSVERAYAKLGSTGKRKRLNSGV